LKKAIVLVGKGIVYDTGGLSLKPTANSMDFMKSDMAGAAAVVGVFCAIAKSNLPIEVIGLIPATDNRPGYNAMAPGDILTFANGKTVEVLKEYNDQIQSDIADINNVGGPLAGAITAGKFLEHFIDYDWIHIDIAGPSFNKKGENYKPAGGTGFGVRLLTQFLKKI
jgi:leucyl aminopeptidase